MGTGAEIQLRLWNKQRRIFSHMGGDPSDIGKCLWHFLRNLSEEQWKALGSKLLNDVKWYVNSNMSFSDMLILIAGTGLKKTIFKMKKSRNIIQPTVTNHHGVMGMESGMLLPQRRTAPPMLLTWYFKAN